MNTEGLTHPDYRIRMTTIHMLVEQGRAETVPLILPLLRDREMPVRSAAIVALGTFADRQAFELLVTCLATPTSIERKHAVHSLMALKEPQVWIPLLEVLKTETNLSVRLELIKAISVFPREEVIQALIELLTDPDENIRASAAIALGKMRQPHTISALQRMASTDTREETVIHGLAEKNSSIANRAIQMILHPEQEQDLDWPD